MIRMSAAANRPINWNVIIADTNLRERIWQMVAGADEATERGARIVALAECDVLRSYLSFKSGFGFAMIPGWAKTATLPRDEKIRALSDPDVRAQLRASG